MLLSAIAVLLQHAVSVACVLALSAAAPPERTLPVDPVELVAGREIPGTDEFVVEREGIGYRFANAANKAAFERDPARFEVAYGGACGRMGPLSGLGDARRFAVHGGRIYLFASDGCRERFLQDPAKHIESEDPMPFGSNERVLEGRATLDRMVAWMGGAERLRAVRSVRATAARTERQGDTDWKVTNETSIEFPASYYQREAWNDSWFATASGPAGGLMATKAGVERIAAVRTKAFHRSLARWPIVIAKAHVDGSPKADCPGLVVMGDGVGELDGVKVEYVRVWLNGAASRLTVDASTGRLVQLSFRGRDGTIAIGDSVRTFTRYVTVDGITLPVAYVVSVDGAPRSRAESVIDAFELNPALPASMFVPPTD